MSRYDPATAKTKRSASPPSSRREGKPRQHSTIIVLLLMALSACGGFYLAKFSEQYELAAEAYQWLPFLKRNAEPTAAAGPDAADNAAEPLATNDESLETLATPKEFVVLPVLDKSDAWIRQSIGGLSPELAPWLGQDKTGQGQLLRNYLTLAVDFSKGERIGKHVRFLKPKAPFAVGQDRQGLFIAPASYQRYQPWVAAINALDVPASLAFYQKIRPLLLQAFGEFNPPGTLTLEAMLIKAAKEILAAPIIGKPLYVDKRLGYYRFADPKLEAAPALHKQLLRMGPENTRTLQNKLQQFADGLAGLKAD